MIYLDANAGSRPRPVIRQVLEELISEKGPRNASSVHGPGRLARSRLQAARKSVLRLLNLGDTPRHQRLVFTSGGTESCNLMVLGFLGPITRLAQMRGSVITSSIEHPAVLEPLTLLEQSGWQILRLAPDHDGVVKVSDFLAAVQDDTALVTLMAANNETGAIQPIVEVARSLRAIGYRGLITSDFTQALGKTKLNLAELFGAGVNAVAISSHKLGAPAGCGALIINENASGACFTFEPLLRGGAQENSFRSGTENLLGALCFGKVCDEVILTLEEDLQEMRELRDSLWEGLRQSISGIERLTPREEDHWGAISNTLLVRFSKCRGDDLVVALDLEGVATSTGSACASGKQGVSHVLTAMEYDVEQAREVLRFSLDWDADAGTVAQALKIIVRVVRKMRDKQAPAELVGRV